MKNLRIEEENITREMALQNGKKLLEEKEKLREMERIIENRKSSYQAVISDKKDSIFYKQLVAALIFGCSLLLDAMFCANAIVNPVFRGATYFVLETSFVGFGIAALLKAAVIHDKRRLNKLRAAFNVALTELHSECATIKDNIRDLERLPHIENNTDLMQYDEQEILESIKRELEYLREEKESVKQKRYEI